MQNTPDIVLVSQLVKTVAKQELIPRFARVQSQHKSDGSLVSEADLETQNKLAELLYEHWPDIPLLSEEQSQSTQNDAFQHIEDRVWCLDPLDGTSNFISGIPYYAISLALLDKSSVILSIVYDPSRDECFTAIRNEGAWLNGKRLSSTKEPVTLCNAIGLIDLKRLPEKLTGALIKKPPYKSQRSFGAVALDWCWLATNRVQVYLHGSQHIWDYAGGYLILLESGGIASTLEGTEVYLPELKKRSAVASINKHLQLEWLDWINNQTL